MPLGPEPRRGKDRKQERWQKLSCDVGPATAWARDASTFIPTWVCFSSYTK